MSDDRSITRVLPGRGRKGPPPTPHGSVWPSIRGYEILSVVGSGGMGIVFKARQRDLNRIVAIKTLRGLVLDDPEFRERFRTEAEAVARLQHPNIIQVFEIGRIETGVGEVIDPRPFIALEYVDGGSLLDRTDKPQPPRYAAGMVEKLARAAHAAHRLGVIHRDLKPANVLLTREGEPKIADFGLAKQLEAEGDSGQRFLTQAGTVVGTPEFMAPEQVTGREPTPAIDVYALGIILYQLLTARVPFQGASPTETFDLIRAQEPVSPRRLQPHLPRDLETTCLKCLEKDPARRYATAEALADDLRRYLDDQPILARRVSPLEKATRWCKRNPLGAGSLGGVAAIFVLAFGLVTLSYLQSEQARAEEAHQKAQAQAREKAERGERYRANLVAAASALEVYNVGSARRNLEAAPEEYRNWEWRHFYSRLDLAHHALPGFDVSLAEHFFSADGRRVALVAAREVRVWDVAERRLVFRCHCPEAPTHPHLSHDGRLLAFATPDRQVTVHEVDGGCVRHRLGGHEGWVCHLQFLSGDRLLTRSAEQVVRFWDLGSGRLLAARQLEGARAMCIHFSLDGRLMTGMTRGESRLRVWDLDAGRLAATLTGRKLDVVPGHEHDLVRGGFSPAGDRILTLADYPNNSIGLWDAATGTQVCEMRGHANTVSHYAFSPDGTRLATASRDQTVCLWDTATGRLLGTLEGHRDLVHAVAFSPDGRRLVSGSDDQTVRLWDAATGAPLAVLHGHTSGILGVKYAAEGRTIVSVSAEGGVRLWDAEAAENRGVLRGHASFVYGAAFHPDGERFVSASWDGTARVWDATTGRQTAVLPHGDKAIVGSTAFHPGGQLLATRARDAVRLWDVATGREVHRWDVSSDWRWDTRLAFNRQGTLLAAGCADGEVRLWDVASRAEVAVFRLKGEEVRDVAFSPDGRWLASVAEGSRRVRVWDVVRGELAFTLEGHEGGGYAVAFNGAGTLLATGSVDGTVRLWDVATWRAVAVLKHGRNVYGVAFTPDGTRLAAACADNSIRFWNVATHQEIAELRGHSAYVHQVAFSPDGTRLVSTSGDGTVRVWDTLLPQDRAGR